MALLAFVWDLIVGIIESLGYPGLFLMMAMESMFFPVPSEVVMPFAGYLVSVGTFDMGLVLLVSLLGSIVGSLASYEIGRRGGRPFVEQYGKYFFVGHRELHWTERFFTKYGATAILVARFIPAVRHVISIPAGVANMPMRRFLPPTIAGAFAWNAIVAYAGLALGAQWRNLGTTLEPYENSVLAVLAVGALVFVAYKVREGRRAASRAPAPEPAEQPEAARAPADE